MVIGWICSRGLSETSWEGLHEAPPNRAECLRVLLLPQWRCYCNFEPLVSHTNVHAGCGGSRRPYLKQIWLRWLSLLCTRWGQVYWHNASLVNNHSLKWRWIAVEFREPLRRGKCPPLFTDTEANNCFSSYNTSLTLSLPSSKSTFSQPF